jgi:tetratricopeptide (TPR) repeat protein
VVIYINNIRIVCTNHHSIIRDFKSVFCQEQKIYIYLNMDSFKHREVIMKFNFSKFETLGNTESVISPIEIFSILPSKSPNYNYLRDVQKEVLLQWFKNRNNKDTIIKMNTGSGKTIVGLLILKSCISENKGPAVYVLPDDYICKQVENEAKLLGISTTRDHEGLDYLMGNAILIINIYKLINGKSIFGMRDGFRKNIDIGSIVIDDVHSAINITEKQFRITLKRSGELFNKVVEILDGDMILYDMYVWRNIKEESRHHVILLPYWIWNKNKDKILEMLNENSDNEEILYSLPFLNECNDFVKCVITPNVIEISQNIIPIDLIKSFDRAKRRVFMSATLSDDTNFITHFGVDFKKTKIITPEYANDIGERFIIAPQYLNTKIQDEEIKQKVYEVSKNHNVIVIVPSRKRSEFWTDVASKIVDKENIEEVMNFIKSTDNKGLYVFINRYDGIDLPDKACELLVIDDLPDIFSCFDVIENNVVRNSERIQNLYIQKIEQGMGRGVRSNIDYCGIILMGQKLVSNLYADNSIKHFSEATLMQFKISDMLLEDYKDSSLDEIFESFNYVFNRDNEWVERSKKILLKVKYKKSASVNDTEKIFYDAYNLMRIQDYQSAIDILQEYVNSITDIYLKSWVLLQLAEYYEFIDPIESQNILKKAKKINSQIIKPKQGIKKERDLRKDIEQAKLIVNYCNMNSYDSNKYNLKIKEVISDLNFEQKSHRIFEEAIKKLGELMGFESDRPENETGKGPDNFWIMDTYKFAVIECKNETITDKISKDDCNQLNGSIEWFKSEITKNHCTLYPILIHNSNKFEYACSPNENIRIITPKELEFLKKQLNEYANNISETNTLSNTKKLSEFLVHYKLTPDLFFNNYSIKFEK